MGEAALVSGPNPVLIDKFLDEARHAAGSWST
jgi:hypothetical protein